MKEWKEYQINYWEGGRERKSFFVKANSKEMAWKLFLAFLAEEAEACFVE